MSHYFDNIFSALSRMAFKLMKKTSFYMGYRRTVKIIYHQDYHLPDVLSVKEVISSIQISIPHQMAGFKCGVSCAEDSLSYLPHHKLAFCCKEIKRKEKNKSKPTTV